MDIVGKTISHYEIISRLGSGGMGTVFKARDLKLDRIVALKFLNSELLRDAESRARLWNEAKAVSALEHPNIGIVYEIDESDGQLFISMSYTEGKTLREIIDEGTLSLEKVQDLAGQIVAGLAAAHAAGIVHRDIKPANILVTEKGQVKILDFGLAKMVHHAGITMQNTVLGTAAYMAPEQILGEQADERADIFAFGATLYEMLTGERPFTGDYAAAVSYAILNEDPVPLRESRPDTPAALERVVMRCLEKKREERYQSFAEVQQDYGMPTAEELPTARFRATPRARPSGRSLILSAALLALLVAALLVFVRPRNDVNKMTTTVAVLPFESQMTDNSLDWLGAALTDLVATNLEQHATLHVVDERRTKKLLTQLDGKSPLADVRSTLQLAHKTKAQSMVVGQVKMAGEKLRLEAQVFDVGTGARLAQLQPIEGTFEQLHILANNLSSQVERVIHITSPEADAPRTISATSMPPLDAYRYYLEGRDAALDYRHQESIEKLKRAIEIDSTFVKPYYWLYWQYYNIGEIEKAKRTLAAGKPYVSKLPEEQRMQYLSYLAQAEDRWKDYASYLRNLIRLNPDKASYHYRYGWVQYTKFRNLRVGISAMERSVGLDSTQSTVYNDLAYAYAANGQAKKALHAIDRYAALNPSDVNPLDSRAEILVALGRYDEARQCCDRILALEPDFQYASIHLVRSLLAQGKYRQADAQADEYLSRARYRSTKSIAQTMKAQVYFQQGKTSAARAAAEKAIELDANNFEARWIAARTLLSMGDEASFNKAVAAFKNALQRYGQLEGRWYLYHLQSQAERKRHAYHQAEELLQKALALRPLDRSFYLSELAAVYQEAGKFSEAAEQFQAALDFNPANAKAALGLGLALQQLGQPSEAAACFHKVTALLADADPGVKELEWAQRMLDKLATTKN
ncbi:MAG: tetratricopeptide repeat protein [Calditrichaeota bacterium]|nr:MAG: tetratricopeptide repeat protein [Calditrichota bacterium]